MNEVVVEKVNANKQTYNFIIILERRSTVLLQLLLLCMNVTLRLTPRTLKQGGLESFGQILISLNGKNKIIRFFLFAYICFPNFFLLLTFSSSYFLFTDVLRFFKILRFFLIFGPFLTVLRFKKKKLRDLLDLFLFVAFLDFFTNFFRFF